MTENLNRMHKVLGSIPNIGKKKNNKGNHVRKASGCHVKENRRSGMTVNCCYRIL